MSSPSGSGIALIVTAVLLGCGNDPGVPADDGTGASSSSGGSSSMAGNTSKGGSTGSGGAGGATSGGSAGTTMSGGAGGTTSSGGSSSGGASGGSGGSGGATDADAAARVGGYIAQLPSWAQDNIGGADVKNAIIDAIVKSCIEFAPPGAEWQIYCEAQITSSILKESSYTVDSLVTDGYATRTVGSETANDPTVGLLQIRFSSTVNDYNSLGPLDAMTRIGCTFPNFGHASNDESFWAVSGPTQNLTFMDTPACNIGLATWYYYYNATGNGDINMPIYAYQYCQGQGVAANLITGLLSHLRGPGGAHTEPTATDPYVVAIQEWFDTFVGTIDPHPFTLTLNPETTKYCR